MTQADLLKQVAKARKVKAPENSVGQWIGSCLWHGTHSVLSDVFESHRGRLRNLELRPQAGGKNVRLPDDDGTQVQIDHAFFLRNDPWLIAESKWLKDKRHLNDKGSWLKQLSEIRRVNSVSEVLLVLGGPWSQYEARMTNRNFKVVITPVEQVYLALKEFGVDITIDQAFNAYADPAGTLAALLDAIELLAATDATPLATIGLEMLGPQVTVLSDLTNDLLNGLRP